MGAAGSHLRLAGWREGGSLLGVCLAAVAPTLLIGLTDQPFTAFAAGFAILALVAALGDARPNGGPRGPSRALGPASARCARCWPTRSRAAFCSSRW